MTGSPNMLPFLRPSRPGEVGGVWPCSQKSWLRRRYRIGSALALAVLLLCAAGESLAQSEMPALTFGNPTVGEDGDMANFEVTLNTAVSGGFTVAVSTTTGGTATADEDFTAVSAQTLSFAGTEGETQEFTVDITDDDVVEGDETFTVGLSGLSGTEEAVDITGTATATITDNDFASVLFLDVFLVVAEDEGVATITVQLEGEVQDGFEITFLAGHETDTAEAGSDYTGTLTTVTFEGTLDEEQEFEVSILDDEIVEDTEFFAVELSVFSRPELEGVDIFDIEFPVLVEIEDNDTATVTFHSQSVTVDEDAGTVTVTAVLDNGVQDGFEVTVSTEDGTAEAGSDYMAVSAQTLSFEGTPNEEQTFMVRILNDEMDEGAEMFGVLMSLDDDVLPEITASDTAPITIIDDERASVTFNSQSVTVDEGAGTVTVAAVLSKRVPDGFEVRVSTADGTAKAGSDYTETSTTLTFEGMPNEEQEFTVDILNGEIVEGTEMFGVSISPDGDIPFAITIFGTATITITDDDRASVLFDDSFLVLAEDEGIATITVLLDGAVQDGFEITFSTEDDTAEAKSDYTGTPTTLTFEGTLDEEQTFTVDILNDEIVEDDEFFYVNPSGFSRTGLNVFVDFPLLVEIEENDTATVTFNSPSVTVNEGAGTVTVTAVLDNGVQDGFEVTVSTEAGTAEAVRDYAETFMTLTFEGRLDEEQTFIVDIVNDEIVEGAEMFDVLVHPDSDLLFYITTDDTATVTIIDDDSAPTGILLALDPMSVTEGSGGGTSSTEVTVTASFTGSSATLISDHVVMVSVAGGTATAGGTDFSTVTSFPVTILEGETSGTGTFQLEVVGDTLAEGEETVMVSGTSDLPVAEAMLTITDDDEVTGVGLSLVPDSVAEGDSGTATTQVTVTARLAGGGTRTAETAVAVTVAGGTATGAGTDFADVTGFTISIPAGTTSFTDTFSLEVAGDTLAEGDETVTVSGSADLPVAAATLTITDDDTAPTGIALSLSRGSTYEATSQTVTVTASFTGSAAARPVATEVAVTVAGGTAMATGAGTDFADVPGFTVTIPATQTRGEGTFQLVVLGDMLVEGDETITVSGSADLGGGGPAATATAELTITDDDEVTGIGLSLVPDSVAEGDSGTATTEVTVTARLAGGGTRTAATAVAVTVAGGTATGAGTDFADVPGFTVTIPATQLSGEGTFQLEVVGDTLVEGDETLTVSGSADLPVAAATLTITDDDTVPTGIALSLSRGSTYEATSQTVTVTASFTGSAAARPVATEVAVTVAGGTAMATGAGTDFADVPGFTVTIPATQTRGEGTFQLVVLGDMLVEGDETITVSGTSDLPVAAATLTITDDDEVTGIGLSLVPDSVAEGDSGTATTEVTVTARLAGGGTRTAATAVAVTVAGGTATGAGTDFADVGDFIISIPTGTTSFTDTFSLEVAGDTLAEGNETVTVSGSADLGGGGPAATATADLTITDDDDAPTEIVLTLSQDSAVEGSSPTVTVTAAFSPDTITLPEDTVVTVAVGDSGDPATEGTDYTTVRDLTLTIAAGSARVMGEFSLVVTDDTTSENGGETVTVSGTTAAPGFTDGVTAATLTITDYDQVAVAVSLGNVGVGEESVEVTVTATLNAAVEGGFEIEASTVDGTATAGSDYTAVSGHMLVFAGNRGEERTFPVAILSDTDAEGEAETFTVSLSAPDAAVTLVAPTSGTVWITDDDTPTVTLGDETVEEGAGTVTVTATLSLAVSGGFTVEAVTADGTAAAGSDYTAVSAQTLSFTGTEGETREFTVDITNDSDIEGDETFTVSLDNLASTTTTVLIGDSSTVTITDDDPATSMTEITLSLDPAQMAETIGTATVSVTASVPADGARARATEVAVTVEGDTAVAGEDFAPVPTFTITIAADEASGTGAFMLTVAAADGREGPETLIVSGKASGFAVVPVTQTIMDETAGALESVGVELARETLAGVSSAVAARVRHRLAGRLPAPAGNLDFPGSLARGLAANRQALNDGSRSWRELLDRSSFEFRTGEDPDGFPLSDSPSSRSPDIGLWAAAEGRRLSNDDSELGDYDGRLFFAHVGADIPIGRGLAGLALSSSRGSFDFQRDEFDSDTRLLNYSLYAGGPVGEAGSLRATVGYGTGEIETGQSGDRDTRDITMTMGILGGRTRVAAKDGLSLDVDGELRAGHLKSDSAGGIGNFALDTRRVQLGLDLAKTWRRDSGAQITQAAKLDLRQDGGDGETGSGAGIEGRLGYINPAASLTATVTGDFLLFHESGLEGGGVGGSVLYRPDATGRGLSFHADSSYTAGREDLSRLWRDSEVVDSTDASEAAVLGLETGYGLPALGGYALLTPYYAFEFTRKDARHHRLGGRLQVREDIELELEGGHRGNVSDHDSERRLDLRLRVTW